MSSDPIEPTRARDCAAGDGAPSEFYRAENYRPEDSIGLLMRRIVTAISQEVERRLGDEGPTFPQWVPLYKLHLGEASTVAELARGCQLDPGPMTRLLDRLEAKGLCRRCRSTIDRRVVNLELTDEGRRAAQQIPALLCCVLNEHLAGFSEGEWHTLQDFLRRILANALTIQAGGTTGEPQRVTGG